ncbi:unnamed protein product [Durusdinium trenchii]
MILGFNTQVSPSAERTAKERGIEIQNFKVIYELKDTVVAALEGDLNQEEELIEKGIAEIKAVFNGRDGKVAGAEVLEGQFTKGQRVHVIRKGKKVGEGKIRTLRRFKEEVTDVDEGNECGFNLDGFEDFNAGDEARCFEVRLVSPELVKR